MGKVERELLRRLAVEVGDPDDFVSISQSEELSHWLSTVVLIGSDAVAERPGMLPGTSCLFSPLTPPLIGLFILSIFIAPTLSPPRPSFPRSPERMMHGIVREWHHGCPANGSSVSFFPPTQFLGVWSISSSFPVLFSAAPFQTQISFISLICRQSFPPSLFLLCCSILMLSQTHCSSS